MKHTFDIRVERRDGETTVNERRASSILFRDMLCEIIGNSRFELHVEQDSEYVNFKFQDDYYYYEDNREFYAEFSEMTQERLRIEIKDLWAQALHIVAEMKKDNFTEIYTLSGER